MDNSGQKVIRGIMDARRKSLATQNDARDIQANLCDEIRREKSHRGLDKQIRLLETQDPDLFKYIRWLEFIQDGIWCATCGNIKHIDSDSTPIKQSATFSTQFQAAPEPALVSQRKLEKLRSDCELLENHLEKLILDIENMNRKFDAKYEMNKKTMEQMKLMANVLTLDVSCAKDMLSGKEQISWQGIRGRPSRSVDAIIEKKMECTGDPAGDKFPHNAVDRSADQPEGKNKEFTITAEDLINDW